MQSRGRQQNYSERARGRWPPGAEVGVTEKGAGSPGMRAAHAAPLGTRLAQLERRKDPQSQALGVSYILKFLILFLQELESH